MRALYLSHTMQPCMARWKNLYLGFNSSIQDKCYIHSDKCVKWPFNHFEFFFIFPEIPNNTGKVPKTTVFSLIPEPDILVHRDVPGVDDRIADLPPESCRSLKKKFFFQARVPHSKSSYASNPKNSLRSQNFKYISSNFSRKRAYASGRFSRYSVT